MWKSLQQSILRARSQVSQNWSRNIVTADVVGMPKFIASRSKYMRSNQNFDAFKEKLSTLLDRGSDNTIVFEEDLKTFVYRCSSTPTDLELLKKVAMRIEEQHKAGVPTNFGFGSEIMRIYHLHQLPDEALEAYNDPGRNKIFNLLTVNSVLMHLLYSFERYEEVLQVFDKMLETDYESDFTPMVPLTIAMGACYKLNNYDSFSVASKYVDRFGSSGNLQKNARIVILAAKLALDVNQYQACLDLTNKYTSRNYILKNISTVAYAKLDRLEDAMAILVQQQKDHRLEGRSVQMRPKNPDLTTETVQVMTKAFESGQHPLLKTKFIQLVKQFEGANLIWSKSIDDCITTLFSEPKEQKLIKKRDSQQSWISEVFEKNLNNRR